MSRLALLVDDDKITHLIAKRMLEIKIPGLNLKCINSPREALKFLYFLQENNLSEVIVFLDLNMPEMNGWQFLDILEKSKFNFKLKVFILTSSVDVRDYQKSLKFKTVMSFVSKPLSLKNLDELEI